MNLPTRWYTIAWIIWILGFIVIEALALADRDKGDTLSEHVWALIFTGGRPRPVVCYIVGGFLVWMLVHVLGRGRWG